MNVMLQSVTAQTVIEKTESLFPWLDLLEADEIRAFYSDLFDAIQQALHLSNWAEVQMTIEDWRATAEIGADSPLSAALEKPVEAGDWEDWEPVRANLLNQN